MDVVYIFLIVCIVGVNSEKCVLGGIHCQCSENMEIVMYKGGCVKELDHIKMSPRDEIKVRVLDLQDNCLKTVSHEDLSRFPRLKTLNIKNQRSFMCSSFQLTKTVNVISDCDLSRRSDSLLTVILRTTTSTDLATPRVTTTTTGRKKAPTSTARPTEQVTRNYRNITFRTRKFPPKIEIITVITTTESVTTEDAVETTVADTSTALTVVTQESGVRINFSMAIATTSILLALSITTCVLNVCCCVRYERSCGACLRGVCVCKRRASHVSGQRIHFPTNRDIETLSAESLELFSLHEKCQ